MRKIVVLMSVLVLISASVKAQMYVTTLASSSCNLGTALADDDGNIYFAERTSCSQIKKIDTAGNITVYSTMPGQDPAKLILDTAGNLYVAYHWSSQKKIVKIPPGGGAPQDYVTNILDTYGAYSLLFDGDTLYFGEYGLQRIYKVLPGGGAVGGPNVIPIQNTNYGISGVSGQRLYDMSWLADGNILAAVNNKLYKVDKVTGTSTLLGSYPNLILSVAMKNGQGYMTMWNHHYVYSLDTSNYTYSVFAGTGTAGSLDGPINTAQFNQPYMLTIDNFGNLLLGEYYGGKVRRIWGCNNNFATNMLVTQACVNDTLILTASASGGNYNTYTYNWYNNSGFSANTKDTFIVNTPALTNTYIYLQVTDLLGCTRIDSVLIQDLSSTSTLTVSSCNSYTSPSGQYTWTSSGTYLDTIPNTIGCDSIITINLTILPNNTITLSSATNTDNQTVCINNAITNITYATTGATGAAVTGLPAGVTGTYNSGVVTISGTPTVSGTFNYTVTLTGGCGNVTATGTITVNTCTGIEELSTN
ncbi:MAG: hypothetical protein ACK4ON_07510, partial [Bacteroidia bacterium]